MRAQAYRIPNPLSDYRALLKVCCSLNILLIPAQAGQTVMKPLYVLIPTTVEVGGEKTCNPLLAARRYRRRYRFENFFLCLAPWKDRWSDSQAGESGLTIAENVGRLWELCTSPSPRITNAQLQAILISELQSSASLLDHQLRTRPRDPNLLLEARALLEKTLPGKIASGLSDAEIREHIKILAEG